MEDHLKRASDFECQFNSWFSSTFKPIIDDSRSRYRMVLPDAEERRERGLSALPSTKSVEVVDKAKESALIEYHKDVKGISYTSNDINNLEKEQLAQWVTNVVRIRMQPPKGFPFFTWHDSTLKAGYTDGMEAVFAYWRKESYKEKKTVFIDNTTGQEIEESLYLLAKENYPQIQQIDPTVPPFDVVFTKKTVEIEHVCRDTWWLDQLKPGENILWDFKSPMLDVNLGQICMVKIRKTVDEVMSYVKHGVFDKVKREEIEKYRSLETTSSLAESDPTAIDQRIKSSDLGDQNTVELWILWEKIDFRWMVSFSIEGKFCLTKERKPSDDVFFNGRKVNVLPVRIGYIDKALHENIPRSLPQVIAPIEDQYIDHINNVNDIAKNIARGGRIRIAPGADVEIDDVLNGGAFMAEQGDVEFIQYNPGVIEGMRAGDMHSAAMNAVAPAGVSAVNLAPKGTNKTLGAAQMIQGVTDAKRYVQLMVRNETFFKPLLWIIAQLEFAYETDEQVLRQAAALVPGFTPPMVMRAGEPSIDLSKFDFDVDVKINAGLGEMPDVQKFNNLMQFKMFCDQIGVRLDPLMLGQMGATLSGYAFDRFNPQPPQSPEPKPNLDSKLSVSADWVDLPEPVKMALIEKWMTGQVATDTKIDAKMKEFMQNGAPNPGAMPMQDMRSGPAADGMSMGGQIGGRGGY